MTSKIHIGLIPIGQLVPKEDSHIMIVRSSKVSLSSMSQQSCNAIFKVLSKHYSRVSICMVNDLSGLERIAKMRPDLVFLGMKYIITGKNEDGKIQKLWLPDYLEELDIAYTGSDHDSLKLESVKPLAKQRVAEKGLTTADFLVIKQGAKLSRADIVLGFPLFIKPTSHGGGYGIDSSSVVNDFHQLMARVRYIDSSLMTDSLVEEYLTGREFSVALLKDQDSKEFIAMPIELIAPIDKRGQRILTNKVKSTNRETALKIKEESVKTAVCDLAIKVFEALGARDYGRIDIRLDNLGKAHFLEANLLPSLISGYGSFPKACLINNDLGYDQMILNITRLGLDRRTVIDSQNELDGILPLTTLEAAF